MIGAYLDNLKLKHIAISQKNQLWKLKGSKYIQSELGNIFKYVKDNINDKKILFVGTPCQIGGLKAFLKKDYNNLITIDTICHGVPSNTLFKTYVNYLEVNNQKLHNYNFRDKSSGWLNYGAKATFNNQEVLISNENNIYMKLYLTNLDLRDCCYHCHYKLGNKYSDITLGDFGGITKTSLKQSETGTSAVIINTAKGEDLFNSIKDNIVYQQCEIDTIIKGNPSLVSSSSVDVNKRNKYLEDLGKLSFDKFI